MVLLVDEVIVELDEQDINDIQLHLVESKSLTDFDASKSGFVQRALSKVVTGAAKAAKWVVGGLGKLFRRTRKAKTQVANQQVQHQSMTMQDKLAREIKRFQKGEHTAMRLHQNAIRLVKGAHEAMFKVGVESAGTEAITGKLRIGRREKAWLQSAVEEELRYLRVFLRKVIAGKASEKEIAKRINAYVATLKHIYYSGRIVGSPDHMIVDWVTAMDRKVCASCRFLQGWSPYSRMTLPTTPRAGQTICRYNCRCRLVMRPALPDDLKKVERRQQPKGWYRNRLEALMKRGK